MLLVDAWVNMMCSCLVILLRASLGTRHKAHLKATCAAHAHHDGDFTPDLHSDASLHPWLPDKFLLLCYNELWC